MPISVGEVNAAIRFSIIQDQIREAQINLAQLRDQFYAAGGAATVAGQQIHQTMFQAQQGLMELKKQVENTGEGVSQLDRLALRMVERLAILYALRGTFDFVKGLYDAAYAMVQMSDRTGNSIHMLELWTAAGSKAGVPANDLSNAVETLNKNLNEFKGGDALHELGLSFEQIFDMSPDLRIKSIADALERIPSPAERSRIEIQLFGTDAIDPLIRKFNELAEAAKKGLPSEESVRILAQAESGYRSVFDNIKKYATEGFAAAIDGSSRLATTLVGSMGSSILLTTRFASSIGEVENAQKKLNDTMNSATPPKPLMGQEFIDSLKTEIVLTDEMRGKLKQLNDMHQLTEVTAARGAGATTAQYREFVAEVNAANKSVAEQEAALKRAQVAGERWAKILLDMQNTGEGWRGTLETMTTAEVAEIEQLLKSGVAQGVLAEGLHKTEAQIGAVASKIADETKAMKLQELTAEETTKVLAKYKEIQEDLGATAAEKAINANQRVYEDVVATAKKRGIVDEAYYADLKKLMDAENGAVKYHLSADTEFSRQHYELMYKQAKETYDAINADSAHHTQLEVNNARKEMEARKNQLDNWKRDAEEAIEKVTEKAKKLRDLLDMGNSITYDLSNQQGINFYREMNPGATFNLSDSDIQSFIKGGGTLSQLINSGKINPYGHSLPGFGGGVEGFHGGPAIVGEHGPELVNLNPGTSVIPLTPGMGGGSLVINNYINGSAEDVARKVGYELMRTLKLSRQFRSV